MFGDADIKDAIALHRKAKAVSRTINIRAFTHSDDCGAEAVLLEDCIRFFEIALQSFPYFAVDASKQC